ncbi:IS30 family transposase [Lactovum miscens]|uniref:IS30 family transposase n=1 Tax=Lactovum miscens TaxID=190387 RepID=A0A841C7C3_9LACT|nr:hypothetical protein [Lactovum miscens]MBB5888244.1 IS30 family transposase [Lactovum miscens]
MTQVESIVDVPQSSQGLNTLISKGIREKLSLEVLSHKPSHRVCLQTLYNWIEAGRLDVKAHDLLYPDYKKVKNLDITRLIPSF